MPRVSLFFLLAVSSLLAEEGWRYPATRVVPHVDQLHGETVPDPYRWMEDDNAPMVAEWVKEQNRFTRAYFDRIDFLPALRQRMTRLLDYPKHDMPRQRGGYVFFGKNDGLQNQSVIHVQKGLNGTARVLLDPNRFSANGTARLQSFVPSADGKLVAYRVSQGGSDWSELFIIETETGVKRPDHLEWLKASGMSWWRDGLFYSRYDAPEKGRSLTAKNEFHKVYYHRLGTAQSADELVYEDKVNGLRFHGVSTTSDQRFAILAITDRGQGKDGNGLSYRNLSKGEKGFTPVVSEITDTRFNVIGNDGDRLLLVTNQNAPNSKVVAFDTVRKAWSEVISEKPEPLLSATAAGGRLFVRYSKDATSRVYVYSMRGRLENEVQLPGPGLALGFGGEAQTTVTFYSFTSMKDPLSIYRYDIAARRSELFHSPKIPGYRPEDYETKQIFYTSKDGTRVPMFLVHRKGLQMDGTNPALLSGYGGFNISCSPAFVTPRLALLEQGMVFALACLRGGGEYGQAWHEAGMRNQKQNVFDDFIAAGEWLIRNKYTSSAKLAANGTSNGGLLVGAVINQRPELFRVAIPQAGVMDMLRYQKFTIGWNWSAEYGSADHAQEFSTLRGYSPIHNIRKGVGYPSVLVTTADHDDRVVPAHSFKYAAALQAAVGGQARPALIRIETDSGHGASSTGKLISIQSDVYAFLFAELGMAPKYP